jgi:hypothetical protein
MNNSRIENNRFMLDYLMDISEGEWVVKRDKILELRDEILNV